MSTSFMSAIANVGHWMSSTTIGQQMVLQPWLWPACETLHFIGLALLVGAAGLFSGVATWLRESNTIWAYPMVLTLHTIGLALLVGANATLDLRLEPVANGVLHQRLKNQAGNLRLQGRRIDFHANAQPVAKTNFLNSEIALKKRDF